MAHPKNQHYVPKVLLNYFSSKESFISAYDKSAKIKDWKIVKERPINRVASEDYFYDQIENNKEYSFEYELRKIEREIFPIIEKLVLQKKYRYYNRFRKRKNRIFYCYSICQNKVEIKFLQKHSEEFDEK